MPCCSRFLQCTVIAGCLSAVAAVSAAADSAPFAAPVPIVYVADFDLDVANVTPDSGPGQRARRLRGLLPSGPGPMGQDKNPQDHAKHIVDEMADALTDDLKKGWCRCAPQCAGSAVADCRLASARRVSECR